MKLAGLSRQLAIWMASIAVGAIVLSVGTSYVFYYFAFTYWPDDFTTNWLPNWAEVAWLSATALAGMLLAILVAGHFAKRILQPLNAVAQGIRSLAAGDLTVRAESGEPSLREAVSLVEDFNSLADQLQRITEERQFWNAAIAHELRTPVTILRGRLQGLSDGVFAPTPDQFVRLLNQVEGLARLIEGLRAVSLAESGHLALDWADAALDHELADTVESIRYRFDARHQHLVLDLQAGTAPCDLFRIKQALVALLDNAARYAVPGQIVVCAHRSATQCSISVEDEGPGVPPEFVRHAFEAFRRAAPVADGADRGSGLGLAVVAAIAHAHGGTVSCRNVESGGTRFEFSWPIDR